MRNIFIVFFCSIVMPAFSQQRFTKLDDLLAYASQKSITLQSNQIRVNQAQKAKLAAVLSTIDITGNLLNTQFTNNTKLGVNVFPAEAFGGQAGTFREIQQGVQYTTAVNSSLDIKLVNFAGWENLKLAKINIDLTNSNGLISLKNLQENIASNYFNIISLQKQISSTTQNLAVADTLYQIAQNKYKEGLVKQQDVNDSKVNYLNTKENINQLHYLLQQYYISLKILCDIPENEAIEIAPMAEILGTTETPEVLLNALTINNYILKEGYAFSNYQSAKAAFMPTISLQLSNSYNLFNTEYKPLSGNWINSNYIGLRLNIPIPSANTISKKYNAQYDYQLARKATEQARIKADLDKTQLLNDYQKAVSQAQTNQEIAALRADSYLKNKNLYSEGLLSLESTLNSFNAMVNANYNLIASQVSVELVKAKISINNKIK